ncbi:hypothetical protein [Herbaspirillum rubrisubalbicans]|uniref:hypothetical protein n=1 Tax=Herbaspirillum rubrisubalbicans TaxID=80842 RepID=UPI0015C539C9|nr:hypothetical protein [Herbaspirillum rubrisubalbicans]
MSVWNKKQSHRRVVAAHLHLKIGELFYFLEMIEEGAKGIKDAVLIKSNDVAEYNAKVIFGSSAFCNAIQSLKDATATTICEKVEWSDIESNCRHGKYFYEIRNASTHDGISVTNLWIDGRVYPSSMVERFGLGNKEITVIAPNQEIPVCCREFAIDFVAYLRKRLLPYLNQNELKGASPISEAQIQAFCSDSRIPASVAKYVVGQAEALIAGLRMQTADPIATAIAKIDSKTSQ